MSKVKNKKPLVITIAIFLGFVAAYLYIPKTYSIYGEAMALAHDNDRVRQVLGNRFSDGIAPYSKITKGNATIEIPVSGDSGEGKLLVYGKKVDNQWVLEAVYLYSDTLARRHVVYSQ